jgi:dephospho-CoA kinase
MRYRKPIVGLAGGVGSGKSTVARILGELGAGVIDSDALAHEEVNASDVKESLCRWWGNDVLLPAGPIDRKKVAAIVFSDSQQRHRLEALLHPRIAVRREMLIGEYEEQPRIRMIVLDSPLLYETDLDLMCDAVIFVDAPESVRKERSEKQLHWPEGELARREKLQQSLDTKRARADHVVSNHSSLAELRKEVERIVARIVSS